MYNLRHSDNANAMIMSPNGDSTSHFTTPLKKAALAKFRTDAGALPGHQAPAESWSTKRKQQVAAEHNMKTILQLPQHPHHLRTGTSSRNKTLLSQLA